MSSSRLPVYDIRSIEKTPQQDLLIQPLDTYLHEHYHHLHRPHRHSFYHLVLFTKGSGSFTIDFDKFRLKPFQIYFMIPGQAHSWNFGEDVNGYIIHFNQSLFTGFLQEPDYLARFSFFQGISTDGVQLIPQSDREMIVALFESLLREANLSTEANLDMLRIKLIELFITVDKRAGKTGKLKGPKRKHSVLLAFQQLVNEQFGKLKLPKEYAGQLHITPNHLNAISVDMLGKTAGVVIRERIMLEAKRLLTNADMSVTEIAYELGFQDNSYFNRFFRKEAGITPELFRKKFITS